MLCIAGRATLGPDVFAAFVPVVRHFEPQRQAPIRTVACVSACDRAVDRLCGPAMELPVALANPGVDGEEVVTAENTKEPFGGVRPEAVLGEDGVANLGSRGAVT